MAQGSVRALGPFGSPCDLVRHGKKGQRALGNGLAITHHSSTLSSSSFLICTRGLPGAEEANYRAGRAEWEGEQGYEKPTN